MKSCLRYMQSKEVQRLVSKYESFKNLQFVIITKNGTKIKTKWKYPDEEEVSDIQNILNANYGNGILNLDNSTGIVHVPFEVISTSVIFIETNTKFLRNVNGKKKN